MNNKIVIITFSFLCFVVSCNKTKKEESFDFKQLVMEWNDAHQSKDITILSNLYNDSVFFYGTKLDKNTCIENKLSFFRKNTNYSQQIKDNIQIEKQSENSYKSSFTKQVFLNGKTNDYPSYLIFEKLNGKWVITVEGDEITDKNLSKNKKQPENSVEGDFDGDGTNEYMWLVPPEIDEDSMGCIGDCTSYIHFSNSEIPKIKIENCIGYLSLANLGDLNKNGTDEIGLRPNWFTSCWHSYYVWTLKNHEWVYAVKPFSTHCQQWEEGAIPIEIDQKKEGYVIIRYSDWINDYADLVTLEKSVKIIK